MDRDDPLWTYDAARTELDRVNLEAFLMRRRARLVGRQVTPEELAAVEARKHEADRAVTRAERGLKAAGLRPYRPNTQAAREMRRRAA